MECPECRCEVPGDSKFCKECGHHFGQAALTSDVHVGGGSERKHVTIMFSDLSGYTAITEKLDPEEVKEMMSRIFADITRIIHNYDGFIERFIGDAVMAVFGIPKAHEDDPVRALRAACEIHATVKNYSPQVEKIIGRPLTMHTGINTGLVVTGEVDVQKGTHGLTGDAINLASRLEGVANAGEIVVGATTFYQSFNYFNFEPLDPIKVKGKQEPVRCYKAGAIKEEPYKIHRFQGLRADLIGRDDEIAILNNALKDLESGEGSVIAIYGDAGTGKSRLKREFKDQLDFGRIQWREGHAYDYTRNVPYYPLINLLTRAFLIEENDSIETIRSKVNTGTGYLLGQGSSAIPFLGSLFALTYSEIEGISPGYWKDKVRESVQMLLAALIGKGPTVICFEDLHWADPSFIELLRTLVTEGAASALFICTFRSHFSLFDGAPPEAIRQRYKEIRLEELSLPDTQKMLNSLLKTSQLPGDLNKLLHQKAEGNPFYLEEMINSLIEENILSQDNGNWKLNRTITETDIPATIQGVLTARVDKLGNSAKRLLQEASVIGRSFLYDILKRITDTGTTIDQYLYGLESLDLIRAHAMAPELEYIFKHALTQEVVYSGLLKKERREIHERIGLAIEQLFTDRISEFCEILAYHFQRGQSALKATSYLIKSGEKSLKKYALEEANRYFQLSMDMLPIEGISAKENRTILFSLLNKWAYVFYFRGDMVGMHERLDRYSDQVNDFDDKAAVAMFLAWYGYSTWGCEKYREAEPILNHALQIAEDIDDQHTIGYIHTWFAWHYVTIGRYDKAIESGHQAIRIARIYKTDHYLQFKPLSAVAFVYYSRGERSKLLQTAKEMLAMGETKGNFPAKIFGTVLIATSFLVDGDFSKAVEWSEKVVTDGKEIIHENCALLVKGIAYILNGDYEKAKYPLASMVDYCSKRWPYLSISGEMMLAVLEVATGRMNDGMNKLLEIRKTFQKNERRFDCALSEYLLGSIYCQIALGEGDVNFSTIIHNLMFLLKNLPSATKKAESHLKEAIRLSDKYDAMGIKGQALLDLGRLYAVKKRIGEAKDCLATAIETFELCEIETFKQKAQDTIATLN